MTRYLVRRTTGQVYIWTDMLAKHADLEEVHAENPKDALERKPIPHLNGLSMEMIESMGKPELVIFARVRLGAVLDESMELAYLQDTVKEHLLMRPTDEFMVAGFSAGPFVSAGEVRGRSGMVSEVPKRPTGAVNARDNPDQSRRA